MDEKTVAGFYQLINNLIDEKLSKKDKIEICQIVSDDNGSGKYNIRLLSGDNTIIHDVVSSRKISFKNGDYAYILKINNKLSNAIIIGSNTPRIKQKVAVKEETSANYKVFFTLGDYVLSGFLSTNPGATWGSPSGTSFPAGTQVYYFVQIFPDDALYRYECDGINISGDIYRIGSVTVRNEDINLGALSGVTHSTVLTALHLATEIVGQSAIDVIAVALTALHIATEIVGQSAIDVIARALTAKHITTEIVGQSAIDVIAVALTALHLATTMNEVSEIEVTGRVCGAVAVTVESIEALIALLVAMKTQASMTASVDFSDTVDIVATLRACGYTEVEVQLTASMLASLTVRQDAPIDIATDSTNSLDIEVDVQSDSPIEIATHTENNLDLTVIVSPDGAVAIFAPGEYELTAVADVALDDSKAIIADAESAGIVSITVNLLTLALLTDYDADTLSSLDTLSLEALDYIEINLLTLALLTDYDADTLSSLDTLSLEALDYIEIN